MEIRTLETFQIVAQELSLTKAAKKLNYSQPTVTKHIQSLEQELDTCLLQKNDGRYILTFAGEELLKRTTNILREVNLAKKIRPEHGERFKMKLQGHDYYMSQYFTPVINTVLQRFPAISFQIEATNNESAIQHLLKNEIDLAIVSGNIVTSDLTYETIGFEATALCISNRLYQPGKPLEYYLERYPIIIDKSERYSYNTFFLKSISAPTIIDCSSDEVVQNAILNDHILGIVRTGRLQDDIDNGRIKVIKALTRNELIHIVMNNNNLNNEYINGMFNAVCNRFRPKDFIHEKGSLWVQNI